MNNNRVSYVRRALFDQRGQVLPWVAFGMVAFLGMAGLTIDVGNAYVVRAQLQNGTNAAALAAAKDTYVTGTPATTLADQYAPSHSGVNANSFVATTSTPTVTMLCLNMLNGGTCSSDPTPNAIKVSQTASVPTTFLRVLGITTIPVSTTALASLQGQGAPWNVAIIVDSTGSMAVGDSNCGGLTEFQCALAGVQSLLGNTKPCPTGVTSCSGATSNVRISLFTFPNVILNTATKDVTCGGNPGSYSNQSWQPTAAPYTLPKPGAALPVDTTTGLTYLTYKQTSSGTTWNATYQITPFESDYYNYGASGTDKLNPSSILVQAAGHGADSSQGLIGTQGCLTYTMGIDGTGGGSGFGNTYFASSIYAAQSALRAEQAAMPAGSKNAIIFLSDGQANASDYSKNTSAYSGANSTNQYAEAIEFPEGQSGVSAEVGPSSLRYSSPNSSNPVPAYLTPATISSTQSSLGYSTLGVNGKGSYPDWYDQCQQAIVAAQYAAANGVDRVYAVAYGSESSGCSNGWGIGQTDTTLVATGQNQPFSSLSALLPCTTMENIASDWTYFYSDNMQQGNVNLGCSDNNHTTVSLQDIFKSIAGSLSTSRLLPSNAS